MNLTANVPIDPILARVAGDNIESAMRILVTGGAGYIGSVVTEQLLREGHTAVVYDDLSTGHADEVEPRATFVKADLFDDAALRDALRRHRIEAVMHFAGASLVGESVTDPMKYYRSRSEERRVGKECRL